MTSLLALIRLYLLGSLRRQSHLATLFLAVILFMLPAYINAFSLGVETFSIVSKDFGLIVIGYFSIGLAIFLGATSLTHERESRSLYPVLARPLSRGCFLLAHYLTLVILLAGSILILGFCTSIATGVLARDLDPTVFLALYGSFLQAAVVGAICLALSVRLVPAATGALAASIYFIGQLSNDFFGLWLGVSAASFVKALLPDFASLALRDPVIHGGSVPFSYLLTISLYSFGWISLALLWARLAFEEIDL